MIFTIEESLQKSDIFFILSEVKELSFGLRKAKFFRFAQDDKFYPDDYTYFYLT
jgi:hypothetical protein